MSWWTLVYLVNSTLGWDGMGWGALFRWVACMHACMEGRRDGGRDVLSPSYIDFCVSIGTTLLRRAGRLGMYICVRGRIGTGTFFLLSYGKVF